MEEKITKSEAKDIAMVLMATHAKFIDGEAFEFEYCEDLVSEEEIQMIIDEMRKYSDSMIKKIEKKYDVELSHLGTTYSIIEKILYEQ